MSLSVFKGPLARGTVEAHFASDAANADSDLVVLSFAPTEAGEPQVDQAVAVPGGFARAHVRADARGVLEVFVVTGHATDGGQLRVAVDGGVAHDEAILGPVRWVYAVGV
jgi:hypothetical protein